MWGVLVAYFLLYFVWGSTYFFIGVALDDLPPFLLGALRFTVAGLILLTICALRGERVWRKKLILRSAISGVVLLFVDMAVVMLAQRYLTSSFVAIIASSTALWILVLDVRQWRVNFRNPLVVTGSLVGFGGVAMLYAEQFHSDGFVAGSAVEVWLLLFGCISWAIGTLYAKYRSSGVEEQNAFAGSAWQMLFASALFWLCASINGDLLSAIDLGAVGSTTWWSLGYLIVFGSLLAYSAYIWLLKVRPATQVATHAYVNPFVAVLLGVFVGGEAVSWVQMMGLVAILLGVVLVGRKVSP